MERKCAKCGKDLGCHASFSALVNGGGVAHYCPRCWDWLRTKKGERK